MGMDFPLDASISLEMLVCIKYGSPKRMKDLGELAKIVHTNTHRKSQMVDHVPELAELLAPAWPITWRHER